MVATADVSVVIPFHNRAQYIDGTIQSVLDQTVQPKEIIVVNDASEHAPREHLARWASVCRIIDLKENVGPAEARNEGIRLAKGQYIAFLDDDDRWMSRKLEIQLEHMRLHPECALVSSTVTAFFDNQPDFQSAYLGPGPVTLAQALTEGYYVILSTWLARTSVLRELRGFDASLRASEDEDFVIRCCASGHKIQIIPEPLTRFRREGHERISKRNWLLFRTEIKLCWKHRALYWKVFGLRGIISFLLQRLHFATRETRFLDGRVRFLMRVVKIKYDVRAGYQEPVGRPL